MICATLDGWRKQSGAYSRTIRKALEFIESCDFSTMGNGRHDIRGDAMYAVLSEGETSPVDQLKAESHFRYADIHYVVSGEEKIGYAPWNERQQVVQDMRDQDALLYGDVNNECFLTLEKGSFAIFFPYEIHRPWCSTGTPSTIRKLVIKINSELFGDR